MTDMEILELAKEAGFSAAILDPRDIRVDGKFRVFSGFCSGYNGCPLCTTCKRKENLPCVHPDKQISCMSAYCIDVAKLAQLCGMDFAWTSERLHLFGMIAFH